MRTTIKTPHGSIRDPEQAFEQAIHAGRLSVEPDSPRYAGRWMYMHHDHDGAAHFKNINTREYLRGDEITTAACL